ncbi:MAG: hypothetical protein LBQ66_03490 [Planctomycetaceae bacterium]|nr:hypothetical protein [Planctomycetaceae bacterium]
MKIFSKLIMMFLLFSLPFCLGCGAGKPPLGQVEGTVTFNGKPLEKGNIIFTTKGMRDASGIIENGVIRDVTTFTKGDGTPVGQAAVAIIATESEQSIMSDVATTPADASPATAATNTAMSSQKFSIPIRYTNPETSGLTTTIKKGLNKVHFELDNKP